MVSKYEKGAPVPLHYKNVNYVWFNLLMDISVEMLILLDKNSCFLKIYGYKGDSTLSVAPLKIWFLLAHQHFPKMFSCSFEVTDYLCYKINDGSI